VENSGIGNSGAFIVDVTEQIRYEIDGDTETMKDEVTITMRAEGAASGMLDDIPLLPDGAMGRGELEAITEALEGNDFRTASRMKLEYGFGVFTMDWTLASSEFVPTSMGDKTVIDPFAITEAEGKALMEEGNINMMQAMFAAMGNLPPEIIQMLMETVGGM